MTDNRRLHKMALERAKKPWGEGWNKLTSDHREALLAREALYLLLGQCDTMAKFDAGKDLVRAAMGWANPAKEGA